MIRVVYHDHFIASVKKLPKAQQQKLARLLQLLVHDPFYPKLHTKRLSGELIGLLSFRITRDWRVIFQFLDTEAVQLLRTKNRKDIYR